MEVINSDDIAWDQFFLENEYFVINYHSQIDFPVYHKINETFIQLSKEKKYGKIKFYRIDTNNNPIAEQFMKKRKLPFLATFMQGFLVECNNIETEAELRAMLERLLDFKIKL
jgi:thioredoxin 1